MNSHEMIWLAFAVCLSAFIIQVKQHRSACRDCEEVFRTEEEEMGLLRKYVEQGVADSIFRASTNTSKLTQLNQYMDTLDAFYTILCELNRCPRPVSFEHIHADVCAIQALWNGTTSNTECVIKQTLGP